MIYIQISSTCETCRRPGSSLHIAIFEDHGAMSQLSDIYSDRILELAASIARTARLPQPHATATAHSKLCGSTVTVDIILDGDTVADFGQTVKACLLGQASASAVASAIVGRTKGEIRDAANAMRGMLKSGGPPPQGVWSDLAVLEPVKDFKARHASTMLIFEALEKAFATIEARQADRAAPRDAMAGAGA